MKTVLPPAPFPLPRIDLSAIPAADRPATLREVLRERVRQPMSLERGPLIRASLVRLDRGEHVLEVTVHHIVFNGWSAGILLHELSTLYGAFAAGRPSPLPPCRCSTPTTRIGSGVPSPARLSPGRSTGGGASSPAPRPSSSCPPTGCGRSPRPTAARGSCFATRAPSRRPCGRWQSARGRPCSWSSWPLSRPSCCATPAADGALHDGLLLTGQDLSPVPAAMTSPDFSPKR